MYKWNKYIGTQLKRVIKTFPGILILTLVLSLGMFLALQIIFRLHAQREENQVVQVGIVGDLSDSYLGMGITVLKNSDSVKSMANIESMSEQEAREKLKAGEILAYLVIPDGFVQSLVEGENLAVTYVTTIEAQGIGNVLINELVTAISDMVTMSQNAIYAMQTYLVEQDRNELLSVATEELNYDIIGAVLNRTEMYEMKLLGVSNHLSLQGYYFCSIILLFMLLWGINAVFLFVKDDVSIFKILYARGYGIPGQVLSELGAYFVLMLLNMSCILVAGMFFKSYLGIEIQEWEILDSGEQFLFFCKMIPLVIMISAFQTLLYELVSSVINGVLVQFVSAVGLAYISGCLYPISFFPETIQKMAGFLPTGVGLRYLQKNLSMQNVGIEVLCMTLFTIAFAGAQILIRKKRMIGK